MRTLGIDYGDAHIGVAVSDPLGCTSSGLTTISRKNPIDLSTSITRIVEIAREYRVNAIVLGYPKNMDNTEGENCKKVMVLKRKLEKILPSIPVELFDERLTTSRAQQIFREMGTSGFKQRKNIDKLAAAIILQDYLDQKTRHVEYAEISRYS